MFNLKYLSIRDFLSIAEMDFNFNKAGNYLITGYNHIGGDSNGSGKSSILNAIIWALTGKTAKGLTEVSRWGQKNQASVTLSLDGPNNSTYTIIRTPDETSLLVNGEEVAGRKKDIQQSIYDTFHTNYDLLLSSIMFTKGQADFLTDSGDAAKKRLFKSLLRLEKIDKMYDSAKALYDMEMGRAQDLDYKIKLLMDTIHRLNVNIDTYENSIESFEADRQGKIKKLQEQLLLNSPSIDESLEIRYKEEKAKVEQFAENMLLLEEELPELQDKLTQAYTNARVASTMLETFNQEILNSKSLQGSECKYCGSPLSKKNLWAYIQKKEDEFVKTEASLAEYNEVIRKLEVQISSTGKLRALGAKGAKDFEILERAIVEQRQRVAVFDETKRQIEKRIEDETFKTNPFIEVLDAAHKDLTKCNAQLSEMNIQFGEALKQIDVLAYVKWVLSREGVIGYIIQKTFTRLETLINSYLSKICREQFQIIISPKKELKSGAIRDEIDIVIKQNGRKVPYAALSGGQEQRVTIATLLAIYKLSKELGMNQFNFLLLDEVLDLSLAEKGQQDIMGLLESMQEEIRNIFVISHKDALASEFSMQIQVKRDRKGITHLEGVYN